MLSVHVNHQTQLTADGHDAAGALPLKREGRRSASALTRKLN
jgi:hypothetical protein